MINVNAFPGDRGEQLAAARAFLGLPDHHGHVHPYGIVLADKTAQAGYELHEFEAPCPERDMPGNLRAVIAALREAADGLEAGHADLLTEATEDGMMPAHVLRDLLLLVAVTVDEETVESWTPEQRKQAADWAGAMHIQASDNDIDVPPRPTFLPEEN